MITLKPRKYYVIEFLDIYSKWYALAWRFKSIRECRSVLARGNNPPKYRIVRVIEQRSVV
jgi:hypothetical protein